MKQSTFSAVMANNLLTLLQGYSKTIRLLLVMFLTLTASTAWGAKITTYSSIVTGKTYYIGATTGGTDYYLSVSGASTSTSIAGTAVTTKANATAFVFTGSGTSWKIKFADYANYLGLKNSKDNGKVQVVSSAATFTASNQSRKLRLSIGSYSIQKNNSGTQFGSYGNTQTDIWLEEVSGSDEPTTTYTIKWHTAKGVTTDVILNEGAAITKPATDPTMSGYVFRGWTEACEVASNGSDFTAITNFGTATENKDYYAVFAKATTTGGGGGSTTETLKGSELSYSGTNGYVNFTATTTSGTWSGKANYNKNGYIQINKNANNYHIGSPTFASTVTSIKITTTNNSAANRTFYICSSNSNAQPTSGDLGSHKTTTTNESFTIELTGTAKQFYIYSSGAVYISQIDVTYSGGGGTTTYSGYITTCAAGDPCDVLQAPNVTATATANSITLSWAAVDGATSYNIYNYTTEDLDETTSLTYTFTGLSSETEYEWGVESAKDECFKETRGTTTTLAEAPKTYTITFEANGGTKIDKITDATTLPTPLPTTTRDHYTFAGWFTNEGCTQAATAGAPINDNVTLYAKWTPVTYTITFDAGSGTYTSGDIQGNFETGLELPTATPCTYAQKNGWSFVGWSETTISETTVRPAIHTGNYKPTKNITLHAVYAKTGTAQGAAGEFILSLEYEGTTYYVGQTFDNSKLSAETEQTNAARFTIEDNYLHYEGGYISHVATQSSANITKKENQADAKEWAIAEDGNTITFTSTADATRGLGFNYNNGSPRFAAYQLSNADYPHTFTKTSVSGGDVQVTTYNSNPACIAATTPTWEDATIDHSTIQVACGSTTVLNPIDPNNGPATITFNGYDLQNSVKVTASEGFLVSTDKITAGKYTTELTVNPHKDGNNIGKIQNVYVIAQAPAQSGDYTGTITLNGTDITDGEQVINVTAAVTCTQYTIIWSVSGDTEMIEPTTFYAGEEWTLPEEPDGCTDKVFVGWTTSEISGETPNAPAELYKSKGNFPEINEDKIFYAVFATSSGDDSNETTVSVSIKNYAETNSWKDATQYTTINISSDITATAKGESNTGKYYDNGKNWRLYQTETPTLTFNAANEYKILSITITYTSDKTGILTFNGSNIDSGAACEINATSAEFGVGNTGSATNGQVRITDISVTYSGGGGGHSGYTTNCDPCINSNFTISESNFTISKDSTLNLGALIQTENQSTIIYTCNTPNGTITADGLFSATESGTYTVTINQDSDDQDHCAVNKTITIKVVGEIVTLKWSVNGATNTNLSPGTVEKNTPIGTLPVPKTGCDDKQFMGWTTTSTVNNDGSDIEYIKATTIPTENTTYYAVFASKGTQNSEDLEEIFNESFDNINGQGGNDEQWNSTNNNKVGAGTKAIDSLITNHSWNITKGYEAHQCVKMGASSTQGIITTPAINQLDGNAVLTFKAGAWDNDGEKLDIIVEVSGGATISPSAFTLNKAQFDTYTANITGGSSETKITIKAKEATKNRFFIDDIRIAAGAVSFEDYTTRCGTYTVTYHGFEGYSSICGDNPAEIVVEVGSTFTVATCTPEDPKALGRIFAGEWYTNPNGRGDTYKPGDSFVVEEDVVLYAKWTLNTNTTPLPVDDENKDLATTDVVVTGGTTLTLQAGTTTINSLTLKGGLQENGTYAMPVVNIPTGATLVRNNNKINLDLKVNNKSYYPFAVPFEVQNIKANIHYLDEYLNSAATYGEGGHYQVLTYDGRLRAENGLSDKNWVHVGRHTTQKPSYLVPGKGYAISAVPAKGETTTTIRISMDVDDDWFAGGEQISLDTITRNQIAVTAHTGAAADKDLCNAGWNFVANPYLTNFAANNISGAGYINGQIVVNNGKFEHNEEEIPYVTIPNANMSWYDQCSVRDAKLSPMYSFFVQIAEGGTMTFTTDGRQQAPAALRASSEQANPSFEADIVILNSQEQVADHTGLVINDRWTPAYEIGGDLEKMFGTANRTAIYTLSGNTRLAYNALSYNDALVAIPIGFRAQADGEYTIQLSNTEDIVGVECIELKDLYNNQTTNLLYTDYTFYSDATQEDSRFVVYIVPQKNTPTDISTIINGNTENRKIIFNNHLYIIHNGNIYNGAGQMVK